MATIPRLLKSEPSISFVPYINRVAQQVIPMMLGQGVDFKLTFILSEQEVRQPNLCEQLIVICHENGTLSPNLTIPRLLWKRRCGGVDILSSGSPMNGSNEVTFIIPPNLIDTSATYHFYMTVGTPALVEQPLIDEGDAPVEDEDELDLVSLFDANVGVETLLCRGIIYFPDALKSVPTEVPTVHRYIIGTNQGFAVRARNDSGDYIDLSLATVRFQGVDNNGLIVTWNIPTPASGSTSTRIELLDFIGLTPTATSITGRIFITPNGGIAQATSLIKFEIVE